MEPFRLANWTVEPDANELRSKHDTVRLEPKQMAVLVVLVERAGQVVSKTALFDTVWEARSVSDEVLTNAIFELRKALGDDSRKPRFIQTIPKHGYRLIETPVPPANTTESVSTSGWRRALVVGTAVAALGFGVNGWFSWKTEQGVVRFEIDLVSPDIRVRHQISVTPDGSHIAYVAKESGVDRVYVRALDAFEAYPIPNSENTGSPFFSPDGRYIGFVGRGKIWKMALGGSASFPIGDARGRGGFGVSWGDRGSIVFGGGMGSGLVRIDADGGAVERSAPEGDSFGDLWPSWLPGERGMLFSRWSGGDLRTAPVMLKESATDELRMLFRGGTWARYVSTGHIVFERSGALYVVPFDLDTLAVGGEPVAVLDGIRTDPATGGASFDISNNGTLVYLRAEDEAGERVYRRRPNGNVEALLPPRRFYHGPRVSPRGDRLALTLLDEDVYQVHVFDFHDRTLRAIDVEPDSSFAVWTGDDELVLGSRRNGMSNLYAKRIGSGIPTRLTSGERPRHVLSATNEFRTIVYREKGVTSGWDLWRLDMGEEVAPELLSNAARNYSQARVSPSGEWLAFATGGEVLIAPLEKPSEARTVASEGVRDPVWSKDGDRLYYRNGVEVFQYDVVREATQVLFAWDFESISLPGWPAYDVTEGGDFILVGREKRTVPTKLHVVVNWFSELRVKLER